MCINSKYVTNVYTGKRILVRCGKCEACQQEKAAMRSNRIRNNMQDGYIALFSTFTYSNDTVPYIYRHDYCGVGEYPIHRDKDVRFSASRGYIESTRSEPLEVKFLEPDTDAGLLGVPDLKDYVGRIGVLYYKDMQDFFKRLRQNLRRKYGIKYRVEFFVVGEYGAQSFRPHFHSLIYCKRIDELAFRSAIDVSWLYDRRLSQRAVTTIAKDCASYCSSYVNCGADFPPFLKTHGIAPIHHYSKYFGGNLSCFSLSEILEKVRRRDLYYRKQVLLDGVPTMVSVSIPRYVIGRYFPLFKGYCRLVPSEVFSLLRYPVANRHVLYYRNECRYVWQGREYLISGLSPRHWRLYYDDSDFNQFLTRLVHAYRDYYKVTGRTPLDYAIDFCEVWNCYFSQILIDSYKDKDGEVKTDYSNHYENVSDVLFGIVHTDLDVSGFQVDPNARSDVVNSTARFRDVYYKLNKSRKINGVVLRKYNI